MNLVCEALVVYNLELLRVVSSECVVSYDVLRLPLVMNLDSNTTTQRDALSFDSDGFMSLVIEVSSINFNAIKKYSHFYNRSRGAIYTNFRLCSLEVAFD